MKTTLYCQDNRSDKVYIIEMVQRGNGYSVDFAFGRRGSTLNTGSKTTSPVSEAEAVKVFNKLKAEKMKKGYFEGADISGYTGGNSSVGAPSASVVTAANKQTDIKLQLLNEVKESGLDALFADDNIGGQEKFDGKRIALTFLKGETFGVNKNGQRCGIPLSLVNAIETIKVIARENFKTELEKIIIDGECIGDDFKAYDLLELGDKDLRPLPYKERWTRLKTLLFAGQSQSAVPNIICAKLAIGEAEKRALFQTIQDKQLEGIVFKNLDASYEAGRPSSGGNQLKYKFCAEATCLVSGQNGTRRSVSLQVRDANDTLRDIGNCTIPVNFSIPQTGALVEIRYLYCYENGSLYQPVYKGERDDQTAPDYYDTLKFKAQAGASA